MPLGRISVVGVHGSKPHEGVNSVAVLRLSSFCEACVCIGVCRRAHADRNAHTKHTRIFNGTPSSASKNALTQIDESRKPGQSEGTQGHLVISSYAECDTTNCSVNGHIQCNNYIIKNCRKRHGCEAMLVLINTTTALMIVATLGREGDVIIASIQCPCFVHVLCAVRSLEFYCLWARHLEEGGSTVSQSATEQGGGGGGEEKNFDTGWNIFFQG